MFTPLPPKDEATDIAVVFQGVFNKVQYLKDRVEIQWEAFEGLWVEV